MLFNSIEYLLFLPLVFILNYSLPERFRWILLLISSIIFYMMAGATTIIVPIIITLSTFTVGLLMDKTSNAAKKKMYFLSGLFINIGLLAFYKYINFFIATTFDGLNFLNNLGNREQSVDHSSIVLNLIVPLGISYITFQAIGYLIEIKRGNHQSEKNLGLFATYLMFFPKLLSGPIERAHNFIPQLHQKKEFNYEMIVEGLKRIARGLFLKLVVANRLAMYTDSVFNNYEQHTGVTLLIAAVFFTIQMYADFAGYTDMAIGSAQILGYRLMENFDNPFTANSVSKFWRRWHISLSSWVNDYIFNPIVISLRNWNKWAVVYAGMVTFLILGFWHGANWNYIIFGFLQGLVLAAEFLTRKIRKKIRNYIPSWINEFLGISFTFGYFTFSLIFFNAKSVYSAIYIVKHIVTGIPDSLKMLLNHQSIFENVGLERSDLILSVFLILGVWIIQQIQNKNDLLEVLKKKPTIVRWIAYYGLVLSILFLGVFESRQFIYFQF